MSSPRMLLAEMATVKARMTRLVMLVGDSRIEEGRKEKNGGERERGNDLR